MNVPWILFFSVISSLSGWTLGNSVRDSLAANQPPAFDNGYYYEEFPLVDSAAEGRFFNLSNVNFSDPITVGIIFIGTIIIIELALYALDVYYNQTYGGDGLSSKVDSENSNSYDYFYNSGSGYYSNQGGSSSGSGQYQGFGRGWKNLEKIPEWLELAQMTYEVASNLVSDSECQSKAVCELSRNKGRFGSSRAIQESLNLIDVVQYFNLPDGILEVLDEFQEAKRRGRSDGGDCQELYPSCDTSLVPISDKYRSL